MTTIEQVMTKTPLTISPGASLAEAAEMMRNADIRHLPVVNLKAGIIGILSERDIRLVNSLPKTCVATVDDVMTPYPYVVQKDVQLTKVVSEMKSQKYGAAIVVDDIGQVCGIFTITDALAVLADLTRKQA